MSRFVTAWPALLLASTILTADGFDITEDSWEGRDQFIIRTESATYFYDRAGGGISRMIDRDGRDWINFSKEPLSTFPASAAAGYRGMPNAVFGGDNPDAGAGHPGFDQCKTTLIDDHTIRTVSKSGRWAWTWNFTESSATMTMQKADPDHSWWFLYEGPVAGSFNPLNQFWGTSNGGPRADIPDVRNQHFDPFQWAYFGDRNTPRVLLLVQHQPDDLDDTVWYLGSSDGGAATAPDGMMVFGFGRGPGTQPLFQGAGQQFTVRFVELDKDAVASPSSQLHKAMDKAAGRILENELPSKQNQRSIRFYQGTEQRFGHIGEPQRWINVPGHVSSFGSLDSLEYSLNDGERFQLSAGTDLHRLALPGDFNVELAWDALNTSTNHLEIIATYADGQTIQTNAELNIERGNQWPLPYHVDFGQITNLQDVVQIVDGEWQLTPDGVRPVHPWYDRVLSLGDNSWTNYEAVVRLTLHGYTPPQRGAPTYDVTHMGVALRWRGHTEDGRQPSRQWYPLGAQGEYLIKNDLSQNAYRILHDGGRNWHPAHGTNTHPVTLGQPFFIKAQVNTLADGQTVYRFKQWIDGEPEPEEWAVESTEPAESDLPSGSLCLVPHNSDVTIHEVTVDALAPHPWPEVVQEIRFRATADGSTQYALFHPAASTEPRPLLVALHSWSGDYTQPSGTNYLNRCIDRDWHFLHPDFRGINRHPQATCSDFVVSDILDAVDWAKRNASIDERRVYLAGASGGGMASLMMLAKAPEVWTAVSSWVPISNLADWHAETKARRLHYTDWIEASCNGAPGDSPAVDFQYWNRSPISFLKRGTGVPLDLNAGITDGHTGSVPIRHSLNAFNVLANPDQRIGNEAIEFMVANAEVPGALKWQETDSTYGTNTVLLRRESNSARLTLFEGGHEINYDAAFAWLERQRGPWKPESREWPLTETAPPRRKPLLGELHFGPLHGGTVPTLGEPFAVEFLPAGHALLSVQANTQPDGLRLIHALRFETRDPSGTTHRHLIGQPLGEWTDPHAVPDGAFLSGISGGGGWYVDSLQFHFSDGSHSPRYGGPGGDFDFRSDIHRREGRWMGTPRGLWGTLSTNGLLETIGLLSMPEE